MKNQLPFELDEHPSSDFAHYAAALGNEYDGHGGRKYRLCKMVLSGGFGLSTAVDRYAARKAFKWSDNEAFTVTPVTAATDLTCGVTPPECAPVLAENDYVLLQIEGDCEIIPGSGQTLTKGQYVIPNNDADKGKVADGGTTLTPQLDFATALENGTADTPCKIRLNGKLV